MDQDNVEEHVEEHTEEHNSEVEHVHTTLCSELGVDDKARDVSWNTYNIVTHKYTLDGEPKQWLACSLYIACRKSLTLTVGQSDMAIEGNCVNLTKLLRLCNVSLRQFFVLIKKWIDMASLPDDFRKKVTDLERHFTVSIVLFLKLRPIFNDLFVGLDSCEPPRPSKSNKKAKMTPCNANALFEFTWCLFICVKGEFPAQSSDLVIMYHLLLACADFIFANCFMAKRKDLINPNFAGLPPNWSSLNFDTTEPPCIISTLCENHNGLVIDAKTTRFYVWSNVIDTFFLKGYLKGNLDKTGLLDVLTFDQNLKSLNKLYETYVLSVGEFDERIFLNEQISLSRNTAAEDELSKALALPLGSNLSGLVHGTPLTGRNYLKNKNELLTPVSTATQSVAKLHAFLTGHSNIPSTTFMAFFKDCPDSLIEGLVTRQKEMAAQFLLAYSPLSSEETAGNHLNLAEALYYRLLEMILIEEMRKKATVNLEKAITQERFNQSLFVCCVEIVIYAYGVGHVRFPWVLHCFKMDAFYFYKIIEIVVQEIKESLSRDIIKHLNTIEESVLEAYAWTSNSVIWEQIENMAGPIPPWSEVRIPENSQSVNPSVVPYPSSNTVKRLQTLSGVFLSPVSSSDRFVNIPTAGAEMAKKQLFKDTTIKPGQSLLNQNAGVIKVNLTSANAVEKASLAKDSPSGKRSVKGGSLGLFFRKFYQLAAVRMVDLCHRLQLENEEFKQKIWTCLEHAIIHQTHLMKDRHLDQILMCSVYVVCKVSNSEENKVEQTFSDLLKCYRLQPQATGSVYRSVLINSRSSAPTTPCENDGDANNGTENGANAPVPQSPPSPNRLAGQSINHPQQERGDLIKFYNEVYVRCMQEFVMCFTGEVNAEQLSKLPRQPANVLNSNNRATRRVSDRFSVHPLLEPAPSPPPSQLTYCFSRSPHKDLLDINKYILRENIVVAKRLNDNSATSSMIPEKKSLIARKLHGLFNERSNVVASNKVDT